MEGEVWGRLSRLQDKRVRLCSGVAYNNIYHLYVEW